MTPPMRSLMGQGARNRLIESIVADHIHPPSLARRAEESHHYLTRSDGFAQAQYHMLFHLARNLGVAHGNPHFEKSMSAYSSGRESILKKRRIAFFSEANYHISQAISDYLKK